MSNCLPDAAHTIICMQPNIDRCITLVDYNIRRVALVMKIVIVGSGKVGRALANQLDEEGHEITLIDRSEESLKEAVEQLDLMGVIGNGTSYIVQKEAGVEDADLLIAVAGRDEVNMLSCLIAKKAGNCRTIARVRNPEYYNEISFIREELGLSMSINPEWASASEIVKLIQFPSALEVDTFMRGRVNLIRVVIPEGSILDNMKVMDINIKISSDILICIVERNHEVVIPDGQFELKAGDVISFFTSMNKVRSFSRKVGINLKPIHNVIIAGGGTLGYYLARELVKAKIKVKIIDNDKRRCEFLSDVLPDAMVIHGDATDKQLLLEEGLSTADAFASLTSLDEENIMLSLYANKISDAKLITKINRISFEEVIADMPIGSVICPKEITSEYIVQYVRSMQNSLGSNVRALYRLVDNRAEALEFLASKNARMLNLPISELRLLDNLLICCIYRQGRVFIPTGKDVIRINDNVVVVTTHKGLDDLNDILKN